MNLGALLKWGLFNKWRGFERVAPEVYTVRCFIDRSGKQKGFMKINEITKSPKMYVLKSSKTISLKYKQYLATNTSNGSIIGLLS